MTALSEHLFANGTTALAAALAGGGCRGRLVAVPASVCPSVPAAIFASGNTPLFLDIEAETLGLCADAVTRAAPRLGAVVAVHAYGVPCRMDALRTVCDRHDLLLVEDCAQAEGAAIGGVPVGDFGHVAIFSYGTGKILDLGGGGRAITADTRLADGLHAYANALKGPGDPHASDGLGQIYKFFYNTFHPQGLAPYQFLFPRVMTEAGERMLGRADADLCARIECGRAGLARERAARLAKAALYARLLAGKQGIDPLPLPEGAVPWRFNVAIDPDRRDAVFRDLLGRQQRVSTWYPPATDFLGSAYAGGPLPVAEGVGRTILNLPLDTATDEDAIHALCALLTALTERPA